MNLKPFNLEKALSGAKVVTRDGREVTQLVKFDANRSKFPIKGVVDQFVHAWTEDGFFSQYKNSDYDLFLAPEVVTGWVNVYMTPDGRFLTGNNVHKTIEDAEKALYNAIRVQITFEI